MPFLALISWVWNFAAPLFHQDVHLAELFADLLGVGSFLIDLVEREDHRYTPAACAWLMASRVCGITLSSAAITMMAMSVTCAPRARMAVKPRGPVYPGT
jgi:hypothetical protein